MMKREELSRIASVKFQKALSDRARAVTPRVLAFCVITCIVNSINCIWVAAAGKFVPDWVYNIGTIVLNGGVSMVIFFFVNKIIFPETKKESISA